MVQLQAGTPPPPLQILEGRSKWSLDDKELIKEKQPEARDEGLREFCSTGLGFIGWAGGNLFDPGWRGGNLEFGPVRDGGE